MSFSFQFDYLPSNVLSLSGYDFFQFIKNTLGEPEANLLSKISVRTTASFMLIESPLDIFNEDIEDEELDKLKDQLCFKMKNDKLVFKPGVLSGFHSLKQASKDKLHQQQQRGNKKKKQQSVFNASSIPSSVLPAQTTTLPSLSNAEHQSYVVNLIKRWCIENAEYFGLESFELEEDVDFIVNIYVDDNLTTQGTIKCKCGKIITLSKNNEKIQVSNYYKHLLSVGCSNMIQIRKNAKEIESTKQQQQQQPITSVLSAPISQSKNSLVQISDDELTITQRTSLNSSTQPKNSAKRRLTSQARQHSSNKKIRI